MAELDGNKSGFITDHAIEFLDTAPVDRSILPQHRLYRYPFAISAAGARSATDRAKYANCAFADIPQWEAHPWVKNEGGGNELSDEDLLDRYIGYYAAATEIDDNIARVIGALENARAMGEYHHHLHARIMAAPLGIAVSSARATARVR